MDHTYPHTYNGKLRIFTLDGRQLEVDELIDHWNENGHKYVTLLATDERIYFLRRVDKNHWEVKKGREKPALQSEGLCTRQSVFLRSR